MAGCGWREEVCKPPGWWSNIFFIKFSSSLLLPHSHYLQSTNSTSFFYLSDNECYRQSRTRTIRYYDITSKKVLHTNLVVPGGFDDNQPPHYSNLPTERFHNSSRHQVSDILLRLPFHILKPSWMRRHYKQGRLPCYEFHIRQLPLVQTTTMCTY